MSGAPLCYNNGMTKNVNDYLKLAEKMADDVLTGGPNAGAMYGAVKAQLAAAYATMALAAAKRDA